LLGAQGKTVFDPDFDIDDSGLPHEKPAIPAIEVRYGSIVLQKSAACAQCATIESKRLHRLNQSCAAR
jgi:hypothetical protein